MLANYANDPTFSDQAKCKETALAQIQKGTRAIFQVAGGCGLGALTAAKQAKIWGIGVDADQLYLGRHMLTSALKRVNMAVEDITRLASQGKFKPKADYQYSLKNNGVGLGSVNTQGEEELRRSHGRDRQADRRAARSRSGRSSSSRRRTRRTFWGWGIAPPPRIARDERGTTRSRASGDHEAVSGDTRERPRRLRPPPGRGARPSRRERRGQVDAHEHPLRALQPGRGRDPDQRPARADRVAGGRDRPWDRHGAPALHVDPRYVGRREHRAGGRAAAGRSPPRLQVGAEPRRATWPRPSASRSTRTRRSRTSASASSSASRS